MLGNDALSYQVETNYWSSLESSYVEQQLANTQKVVRELKSIRELFNVKTIRNFIALLLISVSVGQTHYHHRIADRDSKVDALNFPFRVTRHSCIY